MINTTSHARWSFWLVEEQPGPSIEDAADFVESFGIDPWAMELQQTAYSRVHDLVAVEFTVSGPAALVHQLRDAHDRRTGSATLERPLDSDLAVGT